MINSVDEPFAIRATVMRERILREKWLKVQAQIDLEISHIAGYQRDRELCASQALRKFVAIIDAAKARNGRARIGEANRAINLAIKPTSDLAQYGVADVWTSPLQTFAKGAGDCEDYAIAKFVALRLSGIAAQDLRIVIVGDALRGEEHAVATARLDGQWLTLDNRRMTMIADTESRSYRPRFVIDASRVMRYETTASGVTFEDGAQRDAMRGHQRNGG